VSTNPSTDVTRAGGSNANVPEKFVDPGHAPHRLRRSDTDPAANKRAERQVVMLFGASILGTLLFLVAYVLVPPGDTVGSMRTSNLLLGLGLFLGMFGIGAAAVHWAKTLMNDHERTDERHSLTPSDATRQGAVQNLKDGLEDSNVARRGVLKGAMFSALALAPLSVAVPLIGEVGEDWDITKYKHTIWKKGVRLASDPSGRPIKAAEVTIGSAFHVIPETLEDEEHPLDAKAKAIVLMVRMDTRDLHEAEDRKGWSYEGIVAFSKVCTHVGCPVALYEQQTHHLLCPCHQSTFDLANGANVVFGPANRPLPQLPITIDDDGYLVAQSDFHEPIGPSFWERLT
jgi:ubiquinol-cytochrome c reductase iron-sulfur subunit